MEFCYVLFLFLSSLPPCSASGASSIQKNLRCGSKYLVDRLRLSLDVQNVVNTLTFLWLFCTSYQRSIFHKNFVAVVLISHWVVLSSFLKVFWSFFWRLFWGFFLKFLRSSYFNGFFRKIFQEDFSVGFLGCFTQFS